MFSLVFILYANFFTQTTTLEFPMPKGAMQLEGNRSESPKSYDATIKYYQRIFRGKKNIEFKTIIYTPKIKAIHIKNTLKSSNWSGINIYKSGKFVRIFGIQRDYEE